MQRSLMGARPPYGKKKRAREEPASCQFSSALSVKDAAFTPGSG